jgi:phospholipid/cholesterol/gamma-HCH transport system substrate-binding protein
MRAPRAPRAPRALAVLALVGLVTLTGCRGLTDVRLPGGTAGKNPYIVTVMFDDVLNLEQQSSVRVNDVAVGDVQKIEIQGFKAKVKLRIKKDVVLPANTFAELQQTSLFGEKFVALGPPPPPEAPVGRLVNGAVIDRSGRNPETEEVLAALSALLNGGGVTQLQTISVELSNALAGRESRVRDALRQLDSLVGALDDRKQEIVRALENVDALAQRLARQRGTIASALDNIPPALAVLTDQRTQLVRMLTSLSNLGRVSDDVIKNSRQQTVAVLNNLQPILENVDSARKNIVSSLELLTNYPFPTTVVNGVHGDYAGLYASLNLNLNDLIAGLSSNQAGGGPTGALTGGGGTQQQPTTPTAPNLGGNPLQRAVPAPSTGTSGGTGNNSPVPDAVKGLTGASASSPSGDSYTTAVLQGMGR